MKIRVTTDLEGNELVKALSATAVAHGVDCDVCEALQKSQRKPQENPERWAREAENAWQDALWGAVRDACDLVGEGVPSIIRKARPRGDLDWSDNDVLLAIADLIRDAISAGLGGIRESERRRWMAVGIILPDNRLHPSFADVLFGGWLSEHGKLPDHGTLNTMRRAMTNVTFSQGTRLSSQWMEQHGARYVRWFATRVGEQASTQLHTWQGQAVGKMVSQFNEGKLKPTNNDGRVLEDRAPIKTWGQLKTELFHKFKDTPEVEHDWYRIAATESRLAANAGKLIGMQEMGVDEVYFHVQKDACSGCKQVYLNEDGTPKIFKLSTILSHFWENGGLNIGKKQSLIGEEGGWLPVGGALHPWDRCRPMRHRRTRGE